MNSQEILPNNSQNAASRRFARRLQDLLNRMFSIQPAEPPANSAQPRPAQPRISALVESLESRVCPSVTVSVGHISDQRGDSLHIAGPDSGQHVVITEDPANNTTTVQIDSNANGIFTDPGDYSQTFAETFGQIKVKLKAGTSNTVDYVLSSDMAAADRDFRIQLGRGTNFFNFDAQGHAVTDNTLLTFAVLSKNNGASEQVSMKFAAIDNSEVDLGIQLGTGSHNVNVLFGGDITGNSLVQSDLKLGYGNHSVIYDLAGNVSGSTVRFNTIGGDDANGHDAVTYIVRGTASNDARLDLSMALRNGDDTGQIEVSQGGFAVLDTSKVYFTVDGGEGNDTINYRSDGTSGTIAIEGLVDALLTGGNGNDTINTNFPTVSALDLTGTFRVEADGNRGNDSVGAVLSNTSDSNGSYDVLLFGGSGNDAMSLVNNDPTGTGVLYDYFGFDIVDGGRGFDTATISGVGIETHRIDG